MSVRNEDDNVQPPKSDARTPAHGGQAVRTPKSRDCGTKHNRQNLRKLRKLSSIAPAKLPQLGGFFIAAFELEDHAFNVLVILVPPQEL